MSTRRDVGAHAPRRDGEHRHALSRRASRRQLRDIDVPFAPGAYRFENGVRMAGPGCTFQPPSCENMRASGIPTLAGRRARLVAVDEENGTVLFWLDFGPGSLPGPGRRRSLVTFEAFKLRRPGARRGSGLGGREARWLVRLGLSRLLTSGVV